MRLRGAISFGGVLLLFVAIVIILLAFSFIGGASWFSQTVNAINSLFGGMGEFLPILALFGAAGLTVWLGAERESPLLLTAGGIMFAAAMGWLANIQTFLTTVLSSVGTLAFSFAMLYLAYRTSGFQRVIFAMAGAIGAIGGTVLSLGDWFKGFMEALVVPFERIAGLNYVGVIVAVVALLAVGGLILRILRKGV
ncbi:hypothetical protein Pyrde_1898 [Pyrodictium delaneyi]|uniref:Uncharacterized protein n=1 Tax=Pyrodictium delaneyi TaxID=1273541 RepID=A0A0P0N6I6_9CREN|nr:hypothetical protein [Pyrodictium delaneyi]ALL01941.1 hypothetical protein Pyrde_1898 [Pyrodictium delaneyi]